MHYIAFIKYNDMNINPYQIATSISTNSVQQMHITNVLGLLNNLNGDDLYDHANMLASLKKLATHVEALMDKEFKNVISTEPGELSWKEYKEGAMTDYL